MRWLSIMASFWCMRPFALSRFMPVSVQVSMFLSAESLPMALNLLSRLLESKIIRIFTPSFALVLSVF